MKRSPLATAIKLATTGVLAGALVACGGSGGGTPPSTTTTGSSVGPVTGFGSVFVNGKRFNTNNVSFSSDDGIEMEDHLEKGMIVKVNGSWDDSTGEGEATEIEYDDTLRGRLQSVTIPAGLTLEEAVQAGELTITVAGQTVKVDGQTVFRSATAVDLADLAANPGNYQVTISAWPLANGNFRASFVGAYDTTNDTGFRLDDEFETEVKGEVFNHDPAAETFNLNSDSGLQVNYSMAVADEGFSLDQIDNGIGVEVEGTLTNGVLMANEVDEEDDFFGLTGTIEFKGAIEGDYDDTNRQFVLNGVTVQVGNGTEFREGLLESELAAGLLVEVEGSFNNENVLVAREIKSEEGDAEVEALIESIDRVNETMVVGGVSVALTASTLIEDDVEDDSRNRSESFAALQPGHFVEVEGRFRNGVLEAVSIERDDPDTEFDLDGRVTENTGNSITVLGVELLAQNCDISQFSINTAVEVDYFRNDGGSYVVEEIKLDLPDGQPDGQPVFCSDGPDDNGVDDNGSTDDNNGVDQTPG
jgi:hypothetical protein